MTVCPYCNSPVNAEDSYCRSCGCCLTNDGNQGAQAAFSDSALEQRKVASRDRVRTFPVACVVWLLVTAATSIAFGTLAVCSYLIDNEVFSFDSIDEEAVATESTEEPFDATEPSNTYDEEMENEAATTVYSEYVLPESNIRIYSRQELEALSDWEIYIGHNEIYARHGREFERQELREHFLSCSWYVPLYDPATYDAMPSDLNAYEKANSDLLSEIRLVRGIE